MIRKNNKYDKYNILNNKIVNTMSQDNNKFDSKKFNENMEAEIKKKRELRLQKEKKLLEDLQNKDQQEIEKNQIQYEKSTLLYYFTEWLFSIPRLLGYILTFNYKKITDPNNNFLLYIGIWFIISGIILYVLFDSFHTNTNINMTQIPIDNLQNLQNIDYGYQNI